jgi:hypothetical protein
MMTGSAAIAATDDVTFHVYIDGTEVASDSIGANGITA